MPANSKHPGNILLWLEKVIDSCVTAIQTNTCRKMVRLFNDSIDDDIIMRWEVRKLYMKLDDKWEKLIIKEIKTK